MLTPCPPQRLPPSLLRLRYLALKNTAALEEQHDRTAAQALQHYLEAAQPLYSRYGSTDSGGGKPGRCRAHLHSVAARRFATSDTLLWYRLGRSASSGGNVALVRVLPTARHVTCLLRCRHGTLSRLACPSPAHPSARPKVGRQPPLAEAVAVFE